MRGRDIGKAISIVTAFYEGVNADYEFGSAMGAPMDELWPIIRRGRAKRLRRIRRQIKAITGLKPQQFLKEVESRTSPRYVHFHLNLNLYIH